MKRLIVTDKFAKWTCRFSRASYRTFRVYCDQKDNESNLYTGYDPPALVVKDYSDQWLEASWQNTEKDFWKMVDQDNDDRVNYEYITFVQIFPESAIKVAPPNCDYHFVSKSRHYEETKKRGGNTTEIEDYLFLAKKAQRRHRRRRASAGHDTPANFVGTHPKTPIPSKKSRRNGPKRVKDENAAIKEFWTRTLNGERVTQEKIAVKHKLGKQALSKKHYNKKTGVSTDSRAKTIMKTIHTMMCTVLTKKGNSVKTMDDIRDHIKDLSDQDKANLHIYIGKTLK